MEITNPLTKSHPEIAAQFHASKNKPLTVKDLAAGSKKQIWWQCIKEASHVFQTTPAKRVRGDGCPYCSGRRACKTNCLSTTDPEVAAAWHPTKNVGLSPEDVTANSNKRAWWFCTKAKDHVWEAAICAVTTTRRKGRSGCPFCHGKKSKIGRAHV